MGSLRDDLCRPGMEVLETHISWVFLAQRDVWKVKKPISLGFLDFSTERRRRAACEAEVDLNRRLAPDVYHGIVPITLDSSGRHRLTGSGAPVDWAVHMVRLPDRDRADVRLLEGRLTAADLGRIAERIAAFHERARSDERPARFGSVEAITRNVEENLDQGRTAACEYLSETEADAVEAGQMDFLSDRSAAFEARAGAGRVLEGHGDLRLEHIYLDDDGSIRILDCIEFNERFRFLDVCSDVAFLSMDLAFHGRRDLAEFFLSEYARTSNDYDLYPLVGFYESYRAYVRGKVNAMLAEDASVDVSVRESSAEAARRYYRLALDLVSGQHLEGRGAAPSVVLAVGGIVGSGKTTVADRAGSEMMAPVVSSDRTRKSLLGARPTTAVNSTFWRDAYSAEVTERVYREVLRRARSVLESGRPVVIDASFRSRTHRQAAREMAQAAGAAFLFIECRVAEEVCRERLRRRDREPSVSDAREALLDEFLAAWEPVDELEPSEHLVLDTFGSIDESVVSALARILAAPRALPSTTLR